MDFKWWTWLRVQVIMHMAMGSTYNLTSTWGPQVIMFMNIPNRDSAEWQAERDLVTAIFLILPGMNDADNLFLKERLNHILSSVLNHSTWVDLRDKRAADSYIIIKNNWHRWIFGRWFRITSHDWWHRTRVKMLPGEILAKNCFDHVHVYDRIKIVRARVQHMFLLKIGLGLGLGLGSDIRGLARERVEKVTWQSSVEWLIIILIL